MASKPELRGRAARLARLIPAAGPRSHAARTPFVLLVVLLLGGGLIGLLVLNSALSEGSFRLDDLKKETKRLTDQEQALQRDIDAYSAPDALERRARELGMVPGGDPAFLSPDGTVKGVPAPAPEPSRAAVRPPEVLSAPSAPALIAPSGAPVPAAPAPEPSAAPSPSAGSAAPADPAAPAAPNVPSSATPTPGR